MTIRRVFVVWQNSIFHESVRMLLNHPGVEWLGANTSCADAQPEILDLRPDTILVEESEADVSIEAMQILEACPWDVRVISLSLASNKLNVYHREQKMVGQDKDLLQVVLGELR